MWCVGLKIDDGEAYVETDLEKAIKILRAADRLLAHNVIAFDLLVIRKLFSIDFYMGAEVVDTLIMISNRPDSRWTASKESSREGRKHQRIDFVATSLSNYL